MFKFVAGNIWSGDRTGLAVLTNPTVLARRKGGLHRDYPIVFEGTQYADVEAAFQSVKRRYGWPDLTKLKALMITLIRIKFETYPDIRETIEQSGGEAFLMQCSHRINGGRWEGVGVASPFIQCLIEAYKQ